MIADFAVAQGSYNQAEARFFRATQSFDDFLRQQKTQEGVSKLCTQYKASLENQARLITDSEELRDAIHAEILRVQALEKEYPSDPQRFARVRLDEKWMEANSYHAAASDFRNALQPILKEATLKWPPLPQFKACASSGGQLFGRRYLCSLDNFVKDFPGIKGIKAIQSRVLISRPGFPKNSFFYHAFDGDFGRHVQQWLGGGSQRFNKMYVITDSLDQVVGVQFTSESPKSNEGISYGSYYGSSNASIYNFVNFRRKGSTKANVMYGLGWAVEGKQGSGFALDHGSSGGPYNVLVSSSLVIDGRTAKEINVLILPTPTLRLVHHVLFCK